MRALSLVVFVVLQIVFLPLALVGVVLVGYKQMVVSKRLGVSQTAIEIINGRWTMHVFDLREDRAAVRLVDALPNTSAFGLWLVCFPLWVKYKICGTYFGYPRVVEEGRESLMDLVVTRTFYFDRIIKRVVGDMEQFVVLGAGFDTRAYGQLKEAGLAIFEVDQAATQELKLLCLREAGIDASHVTFVSVDFSREDLFEKLCASGYQSDKKTVFLWEGVTLYLREDDVRTTLRDIRRNAAAGSVVAADFYGDRMIRVGSGTTGKKLLGYTSEEFVFGLPFATDFELNLQQFLDLEEIELGESFFMGRFSAKGPFAVVAELVV